MTKSFLTSMIAIAGAMASTPASAAVRVIAHTAAINAGNVVTNGDADVTAPISASGDSTTTYSYSSACEFEPWRFCDGAGSAVAQAYGDLSTGKMGASSSIVGPIDNGIAYTLVSMSDVITFINVNPETSHWVPFAFSLDGLFPAGHGDARTSLFINAGNFGNIFVFDGVYQPNFNAENVSFIDNTRASYTSNSIGHYSGAFLVDSLASTFTIGMTLQTQINADFSHTAAFSFPTLPEGVSFTSQSGAFLTRAAAVPEPSTWSIAILGFGLVGGAMRRRRTVRVGFAG